MIGADLNPRLPGKDREGMSETMGIKHSLPSRPNAINSPRGRSRIWGTLMCAFAAGCVSTGGNQSPSVNAQKFLLAHDPYINGEVVKKFYDADDKDNTKGLTARQQWRNAVIDARIAAADIHYADFVHSLTSERNAIGLGTGLAALSLSTGAAVAAKTTANALSAASAGFTGAGTAFDKQVFAAKTVQVLVTQMDANRATVLARLIGGERLTAAGYTMGQALGDLADYEGAGSLDRALGEVSKAASKAKATADAQVNSLAFDVGVMTPKVAASMASFNKTIWELTLADDVTALKTIAADLKLPALTEPVVARDLKNEILPELDRRVNAKDPALAARNAGEIDKILQSVPHKAP